MNEVQFIGYLLQNMILYPCLYFIRQAWNKPRNKVAFAYYKEAFDYSIQHSRTLFCVLTIFFFFNIILIVVEAPSYGSSSLVITVVIFLTANIVSSNFLLCGIYGYLVVEQRVSYHMMKYTHDKLEKQLLFDEQYRQLKESINIRDQMSPVNFLVTSGIIGVLVVVIFVLVLTSLKTENQLDMFLSIVILFTNYGRQIIVLISFLFEVSKVNEIYEEMLLLLAKKNWSAEKETQRINLYLVMKELPMGSTVYNYRPSRWDLIVQMSSAIFAIIVAIFWAVVFA